MMWGCMRGWEMIWVETCEDVNMERRDVTRRIIGTGNAYQE